MHSISSARQLFPPPFSGGREEEKWERSGWSSRRKRGKERMKEIKKKEEGEREDHSNSNLSSLPSNFFLGRGYSECQLLLLLLLYSTQYFREVNLTALHPPHWTASSGNQFWALCCHCGPLDTAAGCRKTSTLPQSVLRSAAPSCLAAAPLFRTLPSAAVKGGLFHCCHRSLQTGVPFFFTSLFPS